MASEKCTSCIHGCIYANMNTCICIYIYTCIIYFVWIVIPGRTISATKTTQGTLPATRRSEAAGTIWFAGWLGSLTRACAIFDMDTLRYLKSKNKNLNCLPPVPTFFQLYIYNHTIIHIIIYQTTCIHWKSQLQGDHPQQQAGSRSRLQRAFLMRCWEHRLAFASEHPEMSWSQERRQKKAGGLQPEPQNSACSLVMKIFWTSTSWY